MIVRKNRKIQYIKSALLSMCNNNLTEHFFIIDFLFCCTDQSGGAECPHSFPEPE